MHFCDGLAAPCMGGGAWVVVHGSVHSAGWLGGGGGGVVYFGLLW